MGTISIITPSYNQSQYLETMLKSIADQTYPNYEHIIIDGGSTDGSVQIIRSHENRIAYWCSERDRGQSDAINKGMAKASGELVAWVNADDALFPRCLETVASRFEETQADILTGHVVFIDEHDRIIRCLRSLKQSAYLFWRGVWYTPAPCVFFRKELFARAGGVDVSLRLSMDMELWFKMMREHPRIEHIPQYLGAFRLHRGSKTVLARIGKGSRGINEETESIHTRYGITHRTRRKWWIAYKLWRIVRLAYLREWLDLFSMQNQKWQDVAEPRHTIE